MHGAISIEIVVKAAPAGEAIELIVKETLYILKISIEIVVKAALAGEAIELIVKEALYILQKKKIYLPKLLNYFLTKYLLLYPLKCCHTH